MRIQRGTDMAKVLVTESYLSGIANAIRAKNGLSATYTPAQMAAAITALPSGGSGGSGDVPFPLGGANATLADTHSEILTLADTNFSSMTMSTSQQTIKAAVSQSYVSQYFPLADNDAVVVQRVFAHHEYDSGADGKAQANNTYRLGLTYISRVKSSATAYTNRTGTFSTYYTDYLNTSGAAAYVSGTYGVYGSNSACSLSSSGTNARVTIASPTWYARANNTYCKLANLNLLNTTNTKLYWVTDIYSVDQYSTPLGWFAGDEMFEACDAGTIGSLG